MNDFNRPERHDPADPAQPAGEVRVDIRHLTQGQLASLGVSQIAYVRPVVVNGVTAFSIHAADGTPMALAADFDVALAAVNQNEMVPALVH